MRRQRIFLTTENERQVLSPEEREKEEERLRKRARELLQQTEEDREFERLAHIQ